MLTKGTTFEGKYKILQMLGSGGMGIVYEAEHPELGRAVAVKVLTGAASDDEEDCRRFEREARILSRLAHPNIVRFFAYGIWQTYPYIVMERVVGDSLDKVLAERRLGIGMDIGEALEIVLPVCSALKHAHKEGIFHRDIKPKNVMLAHQNNDSNDSKSKEIKLLDFGLARLTGVDGEQKLTRTGMAMGSVLYMSPEQCTGNTADGRSDIYGVGCLLYECLTLTPPFPAEAGVACMFKHLHEPISQAVDFQKLPSSVQVVIERMMAKNPDDRYQSVEELEVDLKLLQEGRPVEAGAAVRRAVFGPGGAGRLGSGWLGRRLAGWRARRFAVIAFAVAGFVAFCLAMFGFLAEKPNATTGDDATGGGAQAVAPLLLPATPRASYALAEQLRTTGRWDDALKVLEHAERIYNPGAPEGDPGFFSQLEVFRLKVLKHGCLTLLLRYEQAQQAAHEAIEAAEPLDLPQQAQAQLLASRSAVDLKQPEEGIRLAKKAEQLLQKELKRTGFTNAHREVIKKALIEIYRALGATYQDLNQLDKAEQYIRLADKETRVHGDREGLMAVLCELADNLRRQGRPREALAVMREWADLQASVRSSVAVPGGELAQGFGLLGRLQLRAGDYAGAEQSLRRALTAAQDNSRNRAVREAWRVPDLQFELAVALYDQGKIAEADAVAQDEERSWLVSSWDERAINATKLAHSKERQLHRQAALERSRTSSKK